MQPTPGFTHTSLTLLSREEEQELFERWKEARDAGHKREENRLFEQIITQYSPIVTKLVKKMRGYRLDPDELTSEALMGLTKAAIDFDPDKGFRFGTYASNCVINTLYSYITKHYFITNVCSNSKHKKVFFGLRRHMTKQIQETGTHELTEEAAQELATSMEVDVEIIWMMSNVLRDPYSSLNSTVGDSEDTDLTHQDLLVDTISPTQDDHVEELQLQALQKQLIGGALETLDDRARTIVQKSVLVEEDKKSTLEQLGEIFSISKERVRQIREGATRDIRIHVRHELMRRGFNSHDILPSD